MVRLNSIKFIKKEKEKSKMFPNNPMMIESICSFCVEFFFPAPRATR